MSLVNSLVKEVPELKDLAEINKGIAFLFPLTSFLEDPEDGWQVVQKRRRKSTSSSLTESDRRDNDIQEEVNLVTLIKVRLKGFRGHALSLYMNVYLVELVVENMEWTLRRG